MLDSGKLRTAVRIKIDDLVNRRHTWSRQRAVVHKGPNWGTVADVANWAIDSPEVSMGESVF